MTQHQSVIRRLLANPNQNSRTLSIVDPLTGLNIASVSVREVFQILDKPRDYIAARPNRDNTYLRCLVSLVPYGTIVRVLHEMRRPVLSAAVISKPLQRRGDAHWPIRYDRARSGQMGSYTRRRAYLAEARS